MAETLDTRRYLGDSVYFRLEPPFVVLYLDNGEGPHTTIYLEPEVLAKFLAVLKETGGLRA